MRSSSLCDKIRQRQWLPESLSPLSRKQLHTATGRQQPELEVAHLGAMLNGFATPRTGGLVPGHCLQPWQVLDGRGGVLQCAGALGLRESVWILLVLHGQGNYLSVIHASVDWFTTRVNASPAGAACAGAPLRCMTEWVHTYPFWVLLLLQDAEPVRMSPERQPGHLHRASSSCAACAAVMRLLAVCGAESWPPCTALYLVWQPGTIATHYTDVRAWTASQLAKGHCGITASARKPSRSGCICCASACRGDSQHHCWWHSPHCHTDPGPQAMYPRHDTSL